MTSKTTSRRGIRVRKEVTKMTERNNWTNEHTVHGPNKPSNWELRISEELLGKTQPQ